MRNLTCGTDRYLNEICIGFNRKEEIYKLHTRIVENIILFLIYIYIYIPNYTEYLGANVTKLVLNYRIDDVDDV